MTCNFHFWFGALDILGLTWHFFEYEQHAFFMDVLLDEFNISNLLTHSLAHLLRMSHAFMFIAPEDTAK